MPAYITDKSVKVTDLSVDVSAQMQRNKRAALSALGIKAVEIIQDGMDTLYAKPPIDTGALQANVHHYVENSAPDTVDVGNDLEYAHFVHEGTYKMKARPYIRDALAAEWAQQQMHDVVVEYLRQGIK